MPLLQLNDLPAKSDYTRIYIARAISHVLGLLVPVNIHIFPVGPGVYSASKRNEYQKQKNNVFGEYSSAGV
jgi:hypothetical protein